MKGVSIFYFFRQQRYAIAVLLLLTGALLMFRYGKQRSVEEPEPESEVLYEQFRSEIDAFEAQLKEKEPAPKTKKTPKPKSPKRTESRPAVQPRVQSMQAIREAAEETVSLPVGESRRIVPMEEE